MDSKREPSQTYFMNWWNQQGVIRCQMLIDDFGTVDWTWDLQDLVQSLRLHHSLWKPHNKLQI